MSKIDTCRSCGEPGLEMVLDLGSMPLADRLLTDEQLREPEPTFPLEVGFCPSCGMTQILETVSPSVLFCEDYPYFSSFSTFSSRVPGCLTNGWHLMIFVNFGLFAPMDSLSFIISS